MMKIGHIFFILLYLITWGAGAVKAQQGPESGDVTGGVAGAVVERGGQGPLMGSAATEQITALPNETLKGSALLNKPTDTGTTDTETILIIGDGLAGGFGAGLARMAREDTDFVILNRFQEMSGLVRPDVYDWLASLPKIIMGKNIKAAVILIGTNDRQEIKQGELRLAFGSTPWQQAYTSQIERLVGLLQENGIAVFWVALPPMANAGYEQDMSMIRALQKAALEKAALTKIAPENATTRYLDFKASFTTPEGRYTDRGPDDTGEIRKLRGNDGVTFLKQGNNRMGQLLLAVLKENRGNERQLDANPQSAPAPLGQEKQNNRPLPIFGQMNWDGSSVMVVPEAIALNQKPTISPLVISAVVSNPLQTTDLYPDSEAQKLLTAGIAAPAPLGRVDDFSATRPPP